MSGYYGVSGVLCTNTYSPNMLSSLSGYFITSAQTINHENLNHENLYLKKKVEDLKSQIKSLEDILE